MPAHPRSQQNVTSSYTALLEEGIHLAQQGDRAQAQVILQRVIHGMPEAEDAWLWLAWLTDDKEECLRLLQEAKQLFPGSPRIREALGTVEPPPPAKTPALPHVQLKIPRVTRLRPTQPQSSSTAPQAPAPDRPAGNWRIPVLSLLAIAAATILVVLWFSGAFNRSQPQVVRAMDLPTALPGAQPTADLNQQADTLVAKAEVALAGLDWESAIQALLEAREFAPGNERARLLLAQVYFQRGKAEMAVNELELAQYDLDQAIRLDASSMELHDVRRSLTLYLEGVRAYQLQDWEEVVHCLSRVRKINTGFRDTDVMLSQGYLGKARLQQARQDWYGARASLEQALSLTPDLSAAQQVMIEVNDAITPPKRVEVSLGEHLVRVYEGHQVIRTFPMCDGKRGSPTLAGRYPVLDKEPLALASQWGGLQMPWWIGLYYTNGDSVNGIENGFHALPYRADQQVMWANSLGGPCSYGCVVLDTADSKWLYDWVEIGTVVFILDE